MRFATGTLGMVMIVAATAAGFGTAVWAARAAAVPDAPVAQARGGQAGEPAAPPQPQAPQVADIAQMIAALPERAPATPKAPRRVLVLGRAAGFVHSSVPLAARTVEALGMKTGAWTTVITFNPADINTANLSRYDALFLASTTGHFLDEPNAGSNASAQRITEERKSALMAFVRGGNGLAGVHASTDAYHDPPVPRGRGYAGPDIGTWPEFNQMIGGFFKFHWSYPTLVAVKVEDVNNPINASFTTVNQQTGQRQPRTFSVVDEIYTFEQNSWSRDRVHVLTSIDYAKMPQEIKNQEPANRRRTDGDYGLSYIRREGSGRVFVTVLGHHESIYRERPFLEHVLAGVQYVLGDLEGVDDRPSGAKP